MLEGLVAAGFYCCFYGNGRRAVLAGAGAAGLAVWAFLLPEMRFAVLVLTALWIIAVGFFCQGRQREQAFLAGGVWLMARSLGGLFGGSGTCSLGGLLSAGSGVCSFGELLSGSGEWSLGGLFGGSGTCSLGGLLSAGSGVCNLGGLFGETGTCGLGGFLAAGSEGYGFGEFWGGNWGQQFLALQAGALQGVIATALFLMGMLYLLGRGRLYPFWAAVLAALWLLTGFLGSISYAQPWQSQVMAVSLYAAVGGILAFQQFSCIRQEMARARWEGHGEPKKMQEIWQADAEKEYQQLRIFEHDFRHHLDLVAAMYEAGSGMEARAYMEDLKQARISRQGLKNAGEKELSYLMMAKRQACRQAEVSFSYQIVGSPVGIAQTDMTALLLNLLDNAIRACEKAPKPRSIGVMLLSRGELWEIELTNSGRYEPVSVPDGERGLEPGQEPDMSGGRQVHGIGMVSVRQIVEKYQGTYRIWQEEGKVRQKLILVQRPVSEGFSETDIAE